MRGAGAGEDPTTPEFVASIVEHRTEPAFVHLLRDAVTICEDSGFEDALAETLRNESRLIQLWETFSADQRWTPSAYVEGNETGWYDAGYQHVRLHSDLGAAVADFIHRMATWLARREVIALGD